MSEFATGEFSRDILEAQPGIVEQFKKDYPKATQADINAFALGVVKMGSYAIKRHLAGESI